MQNKSCLLGRLDTKGFTLIELLVVVLIIGILAAIALPQYQKAVEKSRATQALAVLKSLAQAQENYYLANGYYATSFDELPVEIPWTGQEKWADVSSIRDTRSNGEWSLQSWNSRSTADDVSIYMGRLTGLYQGIGFVYTAQHAPKEYAGQITCAERASGGVAFEGNPGSFCQKVMGGTQANVAVSDTVRTYLLP